MSASLPITQRDVARACGVHPSTICLALKNSPSIPLPTRQRVQAAAEELGYRPNVAARNLALLRGSDKAGAGSLPIAWLNQEPSRNHWRTDAEARAYFENARRRAIELGYHLEEIWTREPGMTVGRLVQIIRARGIEGVIFPVHRNFDYALLTPAWNDFALVGLNDHRLAEWIDVACPDHYRNAETICRQLDRLGLSRVGLALTAQFDTASSGLVHSCFLRHQATLAATQRVPVCVLGDEPDTQYAAFAGWLRQHRPSAIVCSEPALVARVRESGYEAVWIGLAGGLSAFDGGIDVGSGEVAGAAVDCVVDKMRRFEKGMRESTRVHLLKSAWVEPRVAQLEPESVVA
jgi:DNA-binding LacI/PurR family transcriptional regulator